MPRTSLQASRTKKAQRKNISIVVNAMMSSVPIMYQLLGTASTPLPKVDRPRARRMMASKCSSAAVVTGEAVASDSRANSVAVEGMGVGRCVARNI